MTTIGLNTGLRALLSAQYVLDTIGHNIANANTRGYSRQMVDLSASLPLGVRGLLVGTGVDVSSARRSVDQLLGRRILGQVSVAGELDARYAGLSQLEALLGELGGGGIGGDIDAFFGSLSELASAPEDPILRTGVVQSALQTAEHFNQLAGSLVELDTDAVEEARTRVAEVNTLARQIAALNAEVGKTESTGIPANDLRDQRDRLLGELSRHVDVTTQEGANGSVNVLVGGYLLVSSSRSNELQLEVRANEIQLRVKGASGFVDVGGGLGGLLELHESHIPGFGADLDRLARQLALRVNRAHSTAIPAGGGFTALHANHSVQDMDGDRLLDDELVSNAGLPFDVTSGAFFVNVVEEATGDVTKHRIDLVQTHTTVGQLVGELNSIPRLSASLDASGKLTLLADAGYRFDFSARLDADPDSAGTFGSGRASLGSSPGPFALADGDTLSLTVDPSGAALPLTLTFSSADFADISAATAEELAAVVNADPNAQAAGIVAQAVGGRFFLQSAGSGSAVEFRLDGGTAAGAVGWSALVGSTVAGSDNSVDVRVSGAYTGSADDVYTFRPNMDGTIGTTPGLMVDVLDAAGRTVASLDVGAGYVPGTALDVGHGVAVSFDLGELSTTHGDSFALELVQDSDTTDVLVGLGLNALFVGDDAASLAVRGDLARDPALLATSLSGASGDTTGLLRMLDAENETVPELGGVSLGQFYGNVVGGIGFQVSSSLGAIESNDSLLASLEARLQQVSGVNVDEELVDLLQYEQAFAAAAQYITVVNQIDDELLAIL